jgi:type I restriction enzyme S subunit
MWFSRAEFDREACFHAVGGVRGSLEWEDFLNMQFPIPAPEKQREIVSEYNTVQKRIDLNNQLIQKLEETAQTIYKQWFVDFEFPNENGKPYKSNGGEMIESEIGEIPKGWKVGKLKEIVISTLGGDWGTDSLQDGYNSKVCCIRGTDIPRISKGIKRDLPVRFILSKNETQKILNPKDIVIELSGGSPTQSTGRSVYINEQLLEYLNEKLICSNFCRIIRIKEDFSEYAFCSIINMYNNNVFFRYENSSNGVKNLDIDGVFSDEVISIPNNCILKKYSALFSKHYSLILFLGKELEKLTELQSLLLSKMATIEN